MPFRRSQRQSLLRAPQFRGQFPLRAPQFRGQSLLPGRLLCRRSRGQSPLRAPQSRERSLLPGLRSHAQFPWLFPPSLWLSPQRCSEWGCFRWPLRRGQRSLLPFPPLPFWSCRGSSLRSPSLLCRRSLLPFLPLPFWSCRGSSLRSLSLLCRRSLLPFPLFLFCSFLQRDCLQ